jgi:hypothetical protein
MDKAKQAPTAGGSVMKAKWRAVLRLIKINALDGRRASYCKPL